jgi:hypothetical protein
MKKAKDDWAWVEINFTDWREAVDRRMLDVYAITIDDSGFEDDDLRSHWEDKESPFEFVLWFGSFRTRSEVKRYAVIFAN